MGSCRKMDFVVRFMGKVAALEKSFPAPFGKKNLQIPISLDKAVGRVKLAAHEKQT